MSTTQQDKPGGKPRKRNRKTAQPDQKSEPLQSPMPDRQEEDQIDALVAVAASPADIAAIPADDHPMNVAAMPAEHDPIGLQTIANAYGDYAGKSLLESTSFIEKLLAVRSLDKAIEVQTEFTRQAYADFVTETQKICELYRELARQMFRPWGFAARKTEAGLAAWPSVASQSQH